MGNYLKFFDKESDYDIFKESDDFILPNISYTDDTETLHFNTLFIEPEKPKVTLRYNATADNLLALNRANNISVLRIDGVNIEIAPAVEGEKTYDIEGSQITITDYDNLFIECPVTYFITDILSEIRFKAKDSNAIPAYVCIIGIESGIMMAQPLPMEYLEMMGITFNSDTNEFVVGEDLLGEMNISIMDGFQFNFVLMDANFMFLDTEVYTKTTIGGLELPYYFASEGEHVVEIETESGVFGGTNMFAGSTLYSVEISDEIAMIEEYTFVGCTNLPVIDNIRYADTYLVEAVDKTMSSYVMKSTTKWIGSNAFSGCTNWSDLLAIPSSVVSIGNYAFTSCTGLTGELVIPNKVTSIGNEAFYYCTGLTGELVIPNKVTSIGNHAFYCCYGLTSLELGSRLASIGIQAFAYCRGLTGELVIPNKVTSIGDDAFGDCTGLTGELVIPNSVTSIGGYAFSNCTGFTGELVIPGSVATIGSNPFDGNNFSSIVVSSGNTKYDSRNNSNCIIETSSNSLITGCNNSVIPNTVTSIGYSAFRYCRGLTGNLIIPNSVTSIGDNAFYCCYGLTSLSLGSGLASIGNQAFFYCSSLGEITCNAVTAPTISNNTFRYVTRNGTLNYPDGSDYSQWLSTDSYYLGYYGWTGQPM